MSPPDNFLEYWLLLQANKERVLTGLQSPSPLFSSLPGISAPCPGTGWKSSWFPWLSLHTNDWLVNCYFEYFTNHWYRCSEENVTITKHGTHKFRFWQHLLLGNWQQDYSVPHHCHANRYFKIKKKWAKEKKNWLPKKRKHSSMRIATFWFH